MALWPLRMYNMEPSPALVPSQIEVELEGHGQLDVVDPAHLKHPAMV
jgi:hypothetical protein